MNNQKNTKKKEATKTPTYVKVIATILIAIMAFSAVSIALSVIVPMFAETEEDEHAGHDH